MAAHETRARQPRIASRILDYIIENTQVQVVKRPPQLSAIGTINRPVYLLDIDIGVIVAAPRRISEAAPVAELPGRLAAPARAASDFVDFCIPQILDHFLGQRDPPLAPVLRPPLPMSLAKLLHIGPTSQLFFAPAHQCSNRLVLSGDNGQTQRDLSRAQILQVPGNPIGGRLEFHRDAGRLHHLRVGSLQRFLKLALALRLRLQLTVCFFQLRLQSCLGLVLRSQRFGPLFFLRRQRCLSLLLCPLLVIICNA